MEKIINLNPLFRIISLQEVWGFYTPSIFSEHLRNRIFLNLEEFRGRTVFIYAPHCDDESIDMQVTISKLQKAGCNVHVVFLTDGRNGVTDKYVNQQRNSKIFLKGTKIFRKRDINAFSNDELKITIRQREALRALKSMGIKRERAHFMKLKFQDEMGNIEERDMQRMIRLFRKYNPNAIFVCDDIDPNRTHLKCKRLIFKMLNKINFDSRIFFYRGAWQSWEFDEISCIVPYDVIEEKMRKKTIMCYESQMEEPAVPGNDPRPFWMRTEEQNRELARPINLILRTNFHAIEGFKEIFKIQIKDFKDFDPPLYSKNIGKRILVLNKFRYNHLLRQQ